MRQIRKPFLLRSIAVFLLFVFLNSIFFPTVSLALTNGDTQPEYTSYAEGSSTDMVNLLTGDMGFTLPLVEVPGPEGSFSIPLGYKAGIGLEQEASWVGLGFSLNPGSISRQVIQYPDDANGEINLVETKDPGIRGWSSSFLLHGQFGWNNINGHYGKGSLAGLVTAEYQNGKADVGIIGIHVNGNGVDINMPELMNGIVTIASFGAAGAFTSAASFAAQVGYSAAAGALVSGAFAAATVNRSPISGLNADWRYNKGKVNNIIYKKFWLFLDQTRQEEMYGVLNLGKMPRTKLPEIITNIRMVNEHDQLEAPYVYLAPSETNIKGPGSDMQGALPYIEYNDNFFPSSLAKDNYVVMGPGISGSIEPYRLEVGSLSMPKDMSYFHTRYAPVPFKDEKVQFKYEGIAANSYINHVGSNSGNPNLSIANYGIDSYLDVTTSALAPSLVYDFKDLVFKDNSRIEKDRTNRLSGFKNKRLSYGKNIEWYTNKEIADGHSPEFIDFLPSDQRSVFRASKRRVFGFFDANLNDGIALANANDFFVPGQLVTVDCQCKRLDNNLTETISFNTTIGSVTNNAVFLSQPIGCYSGTEFMGNGVLTNNHLGGSPQGIGGFSVTRENGFTYHYAIPIYSYDEETKSYQVQDESKYSLVRKTAPFATSWLLTAVSGPDYVDRGQEGMDEDDWGYWVKLEYGKSSDAYGWRIPYNGMKLVNHGGGVSTNSYSQGKKQLYYLNSISTRSHTALFVKERREDGIGYIEDDQRYQYRLNEIVLLDNKSYNELINRSNGGLNLGSNNMLELLDLTASDRLYLNEKTIKKISFSYSYKLCKGIPNSLNGEGKLTLERISFFGRKNIKIFPDYIFEYDNSPSDYYEHAYDNWGYFGRFGSLPSKTNVDAKAWSIRKITNPLGSSISFEYESDSYSSISGVPIIKSYPFRNVLNEEDGWWNCTSNRYYLKNQDLTEFRLNDIVNISGQATMQCGQVFNFNAKGRVTGVSSQNQYVDFYFLENDACSLFLGMPNECRQLERVAGEISSHVVKERMGGGIRVSNLKVDDGTGTTFETRYRYTLIDQDEDMSSGVVSQEPGELSSEFDYPFTPVMYSKTTVYTGFKNGKYKTKQYFEFQTPDKDMVKVTKQSLNENGIPHQSLYDDLQHEYFLDKYNIIVDVTTSKIGALKSIKTYDYRDELKAESEFIYSSELPENQGVFTEGSLLTERVNVRREARKMFHRSIRTTKRYYPYVLTKIITKENGLESIKENKRFDFITGMTLESESTDQLGLKYKTEIVPAYHIYQRMGPKGEDFLNSNMLVQTAAIYNYKEGNNHSGIISATVQTWSENFNGYRELGEGNYSDSNIHDHLAWRVKENFVWKSILRDSNHDGKDDSAYGDGTYVFSENNKFNFNSSVNTGWQRVSEITRFNHYSVPLETRDLTGNYSAIKQDISAKLPILNVQNASYTEVAFTGFENGNIASDGNNFTDSEIGISSANQIDNSLAHTGTSSYKIITAGEKGVFYKISNSSLNKNFDLKRNYRLNVWVNSINNGKDNAELYYSVTKEDNSIQTFSGGKTERNAGSWIMFDLLVPSSRLLNAKAIEVGVRKKTGVSSDPVFIDDFRFQPLNSNMICYVYNTAHELEYTIDNNNLYSRFEYDAAGRVTATYIEVIGSQQSKERKVSSNSYNMAGID